MHMQMRGFQDDTRERCDRYLEERVVIGIERTEDSLRRCYLN